jgi:hypothetical protein
VLSLCPSLAGTGSSPQCRRRQPDDAHPDRSAVSILRSESLVGVLMPRQHDSNPRARSTSPTAASGGRSSRAPRLS